MLQCRGCFYGSDFNLNSGVKEASSPLPLPIWNVEVPCSGLRMPPWPLVLSTAAPCVLWMLPWFLSVLSVDCSCGMSHELRSLLIPQREAEELVFLETLAHPGTRLPAQLGVILNNLQAVLSF